MPLPPNQRKTIERILADPRYWDENHPEHTRVKTEATRAFHEAYPVPVASVGTSTTNVRAYTRRQNGRIIQVSDYERTGSIEHAPALNMPPSNKGLAFLKEREGFRDRIYPDEAKKDTIGYGHKIRPRESFPNGVTREQAERMFAADVAEATSAVRRLVKVDLNQAQFDALVSLVYNVGRGDFAKSKMLRKLNAGDYQGAPEEFLDWDHAGGERIPGLTIRRRKEHDLFVKGAYR